MAVALVGCLVIWHACSRVRYAVSGVKRTYRGGFVHRSGTQPNKKNIRFKEEKLARNEERLCSCTKHSSEGCKRVATRRIQDDDGQWHKFCKECHPEYYDHVGAGWTSCYCHCRGCQGLLSPDKRTRGEDPPTVKAPRYFPPPRPRYNNPYSQVWNFV